MDFLVGFKLDWVSAWLQQWMKPVIQNVIYAAIWCLLCFFLSSRQTGLQKDKVSLKGHAAESWSKKEFLWIQGETGLTYFLFCIYKTSSISARLSCLVPSVILLVCLPANHFFFSICLSFCMPFWVCISLDHFSYPRLFAVLQRTAGLSGTKQNLSTWNYVMWPPACPLKIHTSVENHPWEKRGNGRVVRRIKISIL